MYGLQRRTRRSTSSTVYSVPPAAFQVSGLWQQQASAAAALQKHHIAQPRSVHRSHGQKRVYAPFHAVFRRLHLCVHGSHRLVERAGDDLALLFFRQLVEVHRVA